MNNGTFDRRLLGKIKTAIDDGLASGKLLTKSQIDRFIEAFSERFGTTVLQNLNGEELLYLLHGRSKVEGGSLAYWLEFKNDEDFDTKRFGSISGGSALKFELYQRQSDGEWITGSSKNQSVMALEEAVTLAERQRDELLLGAAVLANINPADTSDAAYASLQAAMQQAAPTMSQVAWAHKYWYLLNSDRLDDYHSPRYQRFHLLKLLQMPPDGVGILDGKAPRFNCAGRFIAASRELGVPVTTMNRILNQRDGSIHRYWKIGTTDDSSGATSSWKTMRDSAYVTINWELPDLSDLIGLDKEIAKSKIREMLPVHYDKSTRSRKAGEILNFVTEIAEPDLVLACQGQTVLGVGRVRGSYEFNSGVDFPHKRPVDWLLLNEFVLPESEGPHTTVFELGRKAANLLELERRVYEADPETLRTKQVVGAELEAVPHRSLAPLDAFSSRIDAILRRKGQVVFYGPPGTGKTYQALAVAQDLTARHAFKKTVSDLTAPEHSAILGENGLVRVCTFHPGWGYEDFVEGFKPETQNGQMLFERRDGIFKRLCLDARKQPDRSFILVIDEINRGDLPRIFGELITTIEYDKRDRQIRLPVTGSLFSVPRNVYVIGTMNTADRSISLMDTALRRRFGFVELMPNSALLSGRTVGGLPLGPWLDALNARLRKHLKRDARNLQIGHAYLMPTQPISSVADFARILRDDIIPLLEEYCYEDFGTLKQILGDDLIDVQSECIRENIFAPNQEADLIEAVYFEEMQPFVLDLESTGVRLDEILEPAADPDSDGKSDSSA